MAKPRQMTGPERVQLEKVLSARSRLNRREIFWFVVSALTVLPAVGSALALFLLMLLARLAGFPIAYGAWRDDPVTYYGAISVVVAIWVFSAGTSIRWLVQSEHHRRFRQAKLKTDLARGVVLDEVFSVTDVTLLREPEHGMILVFLRLSNGKCFVLYDYDSADFENGHGGQSSPTVAPRESFHLLTFPVSKERRWSFSGPALASPAVLPLDLGPEEWPDDESWCRVKWENTARHFGPK